LNIRTVKQQRQHMFKTVDRSIHKFNGQQCLYIDCDVQWCRRMLFQLSSTTIQHKYINGQKTKLYLYFNPLTANTSSWLGNISSQREKSLSAFESSHQMIILVTVLQTAQLNVFQQYPLSEPHLQNKLIICTHFKTDKAVSKTATWTI
jgi:hypothetical protein